MRPPPCTYASCHLSPRPLQLCSRVRRVSLKSSKLKAEVSNCTNHRAVGMDTRLIDVNPPQHLEEVSREEVESSPAVLHRYNFTLIATLGILLQVKQAAGSPSPFVTDLVTILMFIAVHLIYICSLATVETFHFPTPDLSEFMDNISLLFGSLASILLLLILVRPFGFFTLSLWIVFFLIDFVTKKSYRNALGYFWDKVKELFKGLKVKELFKGQVKNEAENVVDQQEARERTTVAQLQDAGDHVLNIDRKENGE